MDPEKEELEGEEQTTAKKEQKSAANTNSVPVAETAEYKGLQRKYNLLYAKWEKLQADYDTLEEKLAEAKLSEDSHTSEKSKLEGSVAAKDTEIAQLKTKIDKLENSKKRQDFILKEFPELAEFEAEGLLPDANTDEEMKSKFQKFKDTLGKRVTDTTKKKFEGTGAKATNSNPKNTDAEDDPDELWDRLSQLAGSTDPKDRREYDRLYEVYLKLISPNK